MLGLNVHMLRFLLQAHGNEVKFVDESGMQINDQTYGKQEVYFMVSLVVARVITILLFQRMRGDDFNYKKFTMPHWGAAFIVYVCVFM